LALTDPVLDRVRTGSPLTQSFVVGQPQPNRCPGQLAVGIAGRCRARRFQPLYRKGESWSMKQDEETRCQPLSFTRTCGPRMHERPARTNQGPFAHALSHTSEGGGSAMGRRAATISTQTDYSGGTAGKWRCDFQAPWLSGNSKPRPSVCGA